MSRLDGIAAELNMTRDRARRFTRAIRTHFEAAPSYAVILNVVRHHPSRRPSVEQVVAAIKKRQASYDARSPEKRREVPSGKRGKSKTGSKQGSRRSNSRRQPRAGHEGHG